MSARPRAAMSTAVSRSSTSIAGSIERPCLLRARRELPPRRVANAVGRERQNQRHRGHLLDGRRLLTRRSRALAYSTSSLPIGRTSSPSSSTGSTTSPGLDPTRPDVLDDLRRVLTDQAHADAGMPAAEALDHLADEVVGGGAEHAERDSAGQHPAHLGDRRPRLVDGGQDPAGVPAQRPPRLRQRERPAGADEQRHAELRLQQPDLLGHGRLREPQALRRGAERALLGGGEEVAELLQCQGITFALNRKESLRRYVTCVDAAGHAQPRHPLLRPRRRRVRRPLDAGHPRCPRGRAAADPAAGPVRHRRDRAVAARGSRVAPAPARRAAGVLLGAGLFGLQAALFLGAVQRIDAPLAGLLLATYPALVALGAIALRRDRFRLRTLIALALALTGMMVALGAGGAAPARLSASRWRSAPPPATPRTCWPRTGSCAGWRRCSWRRWCCAARRSRWVARAPPPAGYSVSGPARATDVSPRGARP